MEIDISFDDATKTNFSFSYLDEALTFIKSEIKYWEHNSKIDNDDKHPYLNGYQKLNHLQQGLESLKVTQENQLRNALNKTISDFYRNNNWLSSTHPYTNEFIKCNEQLGSAAAKNYLFMVLKSNDGLTMNAPGIAGALLGFEYLQRGGELVDQRNCLTKDLLHITSRYSNSISHLFETTNRFREEISIWKKDQVTELEQWKEKSANDFNLERKASQESVANLVGKAKAEITELYEIYDKKLQLQKPAEHWKRKADEHSRNSGFLLGGLIVTIGLGLFLFFALYSDWLVGKEMKLKFDTVQGVILFGTGVSVYAFLVGVLSKMLFSVLHLMRDAEEREQLTYVYLALSKDTKLTPETEDMILQSIFSRADTGLIKGDSAPKFPTLSETVRAIGRGPKK